MNEKTDKTEWQTLPMELMKHFDDCKEWALMEAIWFKANLDKHELNLTNLNDDTPIKNRGTLLSVLDGLVAKGWINKRSIGKSGKHHKYSLNREEFVKWMKSRPEKQSANRTSQSPQIGLSDGPQNGLNLVCEADSTDNLDNLSDNLPVKAKPEPVVISDSDEPKERPSTAKASAVSPEQRRNYYSFRDFMKSPEYPEVSREYDAAYKEEVAPFLHRHEYKVKLRKLHVRFPQFALN